MKAWVARHAGAIVVAIVVFVYLPTLMFHRVDYDDEWLWSDDSPLRAPTADTWREVWFELDTTARHDFGTEYLPVRDTLVALDMAVWGDSERGPHATQLVLFVLVVVGGARLLVRFGVRHELAWLAMLIWAIHPMRVESVAWLSERKGILSALFVVACGHAWVRFRDGRRAAWLAVAALAAVAATWSKAPAMFAPAALAAVDLLVLPAGRRRWPTIAVVGAATVAAAIPVIAVAYHAGVVDSQLQPHVDGRLVSALGSVGHYAQSFALVRAPSLSYPMQAVGASGLDLALGALAVLAVGALVAFGVRGRHRHLLAALAWLAITYAPVSHIVAEVHIVVADRYVLLPSLAGALGVAWCLLRLHGQVRFAAIGLLCVGLVALAIRAEEPWTSSLRLFTRALDANPRDAGMREQLAKQYFASGDRDIAMAMLDEGLALAPDEPMLHAARARDEDILGNHAAALADAEIAARSGEPSTAALYAALLADAGRYAEAVPFAEKAARGRPRIYAYAWMYADLLGSAGQLERAEQVALAAIGRFPLPGSHMVLARALAHRGDERGRREMELHLAIASAGGAAPSAMNQIRQVWIDSASRRGRH